MFFGLKSLSIGFVDDWVDCSVKFGTELCEELFTPSSPHVQMALDGIQVFTNGSASHHEFQKLNRRINLMVGATEKCGGVYLYANQSGCDGERVYYDGCPLIVVNGAVVAQGSQFSLADVEVVTATIDIQSVSSYRATMASRAMQASLVQQRYEAIAVSIQKPDSKSLEKLSVPQKVVYHLPEEEIRLGPACWLWDYVRRSKSGGFLLPLSGGIDSCATALIVFSMCQLVCKCLANGEAQIASDLETILGYKPSLTMNPSELANELLHTCYMGTKNSSQETNSRASILAKRIGR